MKKEFDKELDYQLSRAALSLSEFRHWGLGYNTGVDVKRNMLEKQLTDFRKEKRKTELQCWEDIISLKKDLRKILEEYKALLNRKELLK
jgi:cyclopropane fatty-acyl-phospholipid synthase-like methyltransferase